MADSKIILPVPIKHTDDAAIGNRKKCLSYAVRHADYEYAELRGTHKSLARYRYAKDTPAAHAVYQKYMDKIDERYGQMDE